MKNHFLLVLVVICFQAVAAPREYIRDHEYYATDFDSKYISRQNAIDGIKQSLIEELGTYVQSVVNVSEDEYGNRYASQDVVTLAAGITRMQLLEEDWNRIRYFIKAKMEADPDDVLQQVAAIRKNFEVEEQLRDSIEDLNEAREQIKQLREQLAEAEKQGGKNTQGVEGLSAQYVSAIQQAEFEHVYQTAMKELLFNGDFNKAFKLMMQLANDGVLKAQNRIGFMYERGSGVRQDYSQAMNWYLKALEKNYPAAYGRVGFLYERGFGVEQNYSTAIDYYRQGVERGDHLSAALLGWLYLRGDGVEKDEQKSFELTQLSIAKKQFGFGLARMGYFMSAV